MGSFGHDVAKATAALFILFTMVTSGEPLAQLLVLSWNMPLEPLTLSMQATTAILEPAEMQPECFPTYQFKSKRAKQAGSTAIGMA
jgi:hypothetical protein